MKKLLTIVLLLLPFATFSADFTIDLDYTGTEGDNSTYSSLKAFFDNHTADSGDHTLTYDASGSTRYDSSLNVGGTTIGTSYNSITVKVTSGEHHQGQWSTSYTYMQNYGLITLACDFTWEDMQFAVAHSVGSPGVLFDASGNSITFK